jgi:hydroxypyruvate reductase
VGLWGQLPTVVREHLNGAPAPVPLPSATNILVGSNAQSVAAMAASVTDACVLPTPIEGDVADAARLVCDQSKFGTTIWGGETTVVLHGNGRGGRNQELALRIAQEAAQRGWTDWVCLQGGSDGRDGPTDAAGGVVDHDTLGKIDDLDALLGNNDSYAALAQAGDLLMTDATGTNVADLGVMIRRG